MTVAYSRHTKSTIGVQLVYSENTKKNDLGILSLSR